MDELNEAAKDIEGIKKYINTEAMDEEDPVKESVNPEYIKSVMNRYLGPGAGPETKPASAITRLGFHSMNLVSPLMLQHQLISDYIRKKDQEDREVERELSDSGGEEPTIGKLTKAERKAKLERYLEKKKKRNWKTIR